MHRFDSCSWALALVAVAVFSIIAAMPAGCWSLTNALSDVEVVAGVQAAPGQGTSAAVAARFAVDADAKVSGPCKDFGNKLLSEAIAGGGNDLGRIGKGAVGIAALTLAAGIEASGAYLVLEGVTLNDGQVASPFDLQVRPGFGVTFGDQKKLHAAVNWDPDFTGKAKFFLGGVLWNGG